MSEQEDDDKRMEKVGHCNTKKKSSCHSFDQGGPNTKFTWKFFFLSKIIIIIIQITKSIILCAQLKYITQNTSPYQSRKTYIYI